MSVRVITLESQFAELRSPWEELFRSNPQHRPYQSWEWAHTWWKHHGREGDLRLILVENDGQLLGIAPLYLARRFRGLPLRHLRMLAHKRADYSDFVVRPGSEATFFQQLFSHLRDGRRDWRFFEVRDLPDNSPNQAFVQQEAARALPLLVTEPGEACVTLPLAATFEEYLATLSKRFRKDIGYYRRSFERTFTAKFRVVNTPADVPDALNDLITVYKARWQEEKGATDFEEDQAARFERELAVTLAGAGLYQLYLLYADDKPAAAILSYTYNGTCYVERFAHSPEFHTYSVGTVLLAMSIEDAIGRGWKEFDLMRGAESYKFRWNGQNRQNLRIRVFRSAATARLVASIERGSAWVSQLQPLQRLQALYRRRRLGQTAAAQPEVESQSPAPAARAADDPTRLAD